MTQAHSLPDEGGLQLLAGEHEEGPRWTGERPPQVPDLQDEGGTCRDPPHGGAFA